MGWIYLEAGIINSGRRPNYRVMPMIIPFSKLRNRKMRVRKIGRCIPIAISIFLSRIFLFRKLTPSLSHGWNRGRLSVKVQFGRHISPFNSLVKLPSGSACPAVKMSPVAPANRPVPCTIRPTPENVPRAVSNTETSLMVIEPSSVV